MKKHKTRFLIAFALVVLLLALLQRLFHFRLPPYPQPTPTQEQAAALDTPPMSDMKGGDEYLLGDTTEEAPSPIPLVARSRPARPRRGSKVWDYAKCFPDVQDVQLAAALQNGIRPAATQAEVEALSHSGRLVHIGGDPFYAVDSLTHSLPYVVPRTQELLHQIGLNFIDSLANKGLPPHLPLVTSVLRTQAQVASLQRNNKNATTNSCHCYGTTIDITYQRFIPLTGTPPHRATRLDDDLKLALAEVLYDLRLEGRCYIKYERKQACFHLTVR